LRSPSRARRWSRSAVHSRGSLGGALLQRSQRKSSRSSRAPPVSALGRKPNLHCACHTQVWNRLCFRIPEVSYDFCRPGNLTSHFPWRILD
jgi:hypothetical protein